MARNNNKDCRHQVSNGDDDDFVVYKWEFPEPKEKQRVTKSFVARAVSIVNEFVTHLRRLVMK